MSASRRDAEVLALFEEALARPDPERARFLDESTQDRPGVRAEVERLLALESEGADMPRVAMPSEAPGLSDDAAPELRPGARVGSFVVEEVLGRGGMGRVHVALQENPRRRVALKTLRRGLASDDAVRRFQVEGELLGHLNHPGIAQVFETGVQRISTPDGEVELPYIALELLEDARPIVQHARAADLGVEERARLVAQVARAVHHAHQKGVIHRDLKPDNLLVDAGGRPRVIDFGIARASELELPGVAVETRAGQLLGTPTYMSPEQLTLDPAELDTRVDVYALGAVLYELVCGRPPVVGDGAPLAAVAHRVVEGEIPRPRSLAPDLSRDLEAIVLRAIARDRDDRYASAAALADDLERYLRHETVTAQRPTLVHQLRLFSRRNKLFAASVVLAVVSLVSATGISIAFALDARRAETEERAARGRADAFLTTLFDANLSLVFEHAEDVGALPGGLQLRARMLADASDRLAALEAEARDDPEHLGAIARAYVRLGDALGAHDQPSLGDLAGAADAYDRAGRLLDEVGEDEPELVRARMDVASARGDQARAETDFEAALAHYREAIALGEAELARRPDNPNLRWDLLRRRRDLGAALSLQGDQEGALAEFEAVAAGWEAEVERTPGEAVPRFNLANAVSSVAAATMKTGRAAESLPIFRESLQRYRELAAAGDRRGDRGLVGGRFGFTEALIHAERFDEAVEECHAGLAKADALLLADPSDVQVRRWRGVLFYNAGWAHHRRADGERAAGAHPYESLEAALEEFARSYDVFAELEDEGLLLPFERDHLASIEDRIERIEGELEAE